MKIKCYKIAILPLRLYLPNLYETSCYLKYDMERQRLLQLYEIENHTWVLMYALIIKRAEKMRW